MPEGQSGGDSTALTVHEAADAFGAMFAAEEADTETGANDTPSKEAKPAAKPALVPDDAKDDEPAEEVAEDETPDADDDAPADDADAKPDEDEDAPEKTPPQPEKHKVKVEDQELEVTLDEALKGYSRTADYTRKTQKLAEERRAFEAERSAITAERQQLHAKITAIEEALQAQVAEPDWDALRAHDPDLFVQARAAWSVQKERQELVAAERQKVERQLAEETMKQRSALVQKESQLLIEKVPELGDPEKGKKILAELFDYGQQLGYSPQELSEVGDHRAMLLLRKAMLYDKQLADAEKKTATAERKIEKVKTAAPGSPTGNRSKPTEYQRSKQRLSKTGKVEDAALAFQHLFAD